MRKAKVLPKTIKLNKKTGETPLECLNRFRKSHPTYKKVKMTYAGRLDPMAEGELLVLIGEECKKKEKYLRLDKEYKVDILFGFETDSYDLLGLVKVPLKNNSEIICTSPILSEQEGLPALHNLTILFQKQKNYACVSEGSFLKGFVKKFKQPYPPYSSKLWAQARAGTLDDREQQNKMVEIYNIKLVKNSTISKKVLSEYISKTIGLVKGDFRQKIILKKWQQVLTKTGSIKFPIVSIKVRCSSGTYMRSLAHNIGKEVGIPTLALRIKRTCIYQK